MSSGSINKIIRSSAVAVLLMAAVLFSGGCATDKSVIAQADDVHTGLQPAVINDPQLAGYLQKVGDRIIAAAKKYDKQSEDQPASHKNGEDNSWMFQDMKFHFVNSKTVNAFTTGGEHMYVYTALFEMCKTEDELAAVMAHEFAHVYCRHVQKGTNRQYATLAAAAVAGVGGAAVGGKEHAMEYGGYAAGLAMVGGQLAGTKFTSNDENQADKYGFKFYTQAGWDPAKFGDFFQHMIDAGFDANASGDHPSLASRVEAANRRRSELSKNSGAYKKPDTASDSEFASLKARAKDVSAKMPDDKSLQQAQQLLSAFNSCVAAKDSPEQIKARQEIQQKLDAAQKAQAQ